MGENGQEKWPSGAGSSSYSLSQLKMVGFEQTVADPRNNYSGIGATVRPPGIIRLERTVAISVSFESQSHGRLCRQQTLRWRSKPELGFAPRRLQTLARAS